MKLCSYVMTHDVGFAPNPFWDFCTLATCTPNHQRCNLDKGDWIVGHSTADEGNLLIYAMEIAEERLSLDEYRRDERFARKRPGNGWRHRSGDNIYYLNSKSKYRQDAAAGFHHDAESQAKDLRGDRVFVATRFCYFGEDAQPFPRAFTSLIRRGRGVKYHRGLVVERFIKWLENTHRPGRTGLPRDRDDGDECASDEDGC